MGILEGKTLAAAGSKKRSEGQNVNIRGGTTYKT